MKRFLILVLMAVLAWQGTGMAQPGKAKGSSKSKVDGAILKVLESATGAQNSAIQTARALGVPFDGNSLTITVVFTPGRGTSGAVTSAVAQTFGGANVITSRSKTFVRLKLPVSMLPLLDTLLQLLPDIAYIRPPLAPQTLAVSEGVSLMGADGLHAAGTLGQGVKVAVIDLGFAGLSTARGRGELPSNVITRDFTGTGLEFGTNHGTAVAEIVHDVAPNAQLYLMKIGDEIDLENAVNEAIAQGVRIINHSVGWFNTSYYDGTGVIANIAQTAASADLLWVNSAGNYALRHYKGLFRDSNGNSWTEFSGSDESIDIQANAGETIHLYLTWRDWPFTSQDYDLVLLSAQGAQVAVSDKTQNGAQEPTETLRYFVPTSGTYRVQVQAYSSTSPKELTLFSLFHDIQYSVAQSSIVTPADVSSVLSVAAISKENWATGPQGSYSSQGPTNDGRPKPDIAGPDNVTTSTMGLFEGTSAATPHVAGAAALLLSQSNSMTASQLSAQLRSTATPVGSSLATGSGRVALTPPVTPRPDLTVLLTDFSPRTPNVGDLLQHTITVQNQGSASAGSFVVRLQDAAGADQRTVASLAAGATAVVSFTRTLGVAQDTITITVDATGQVAESNESNNTAQYQITGQTPPPASLPDLVVESLTANPQNPTVGSAFQLIAVVRNQGSAAAGAFRVDIQTGAGTSTQSIGGLGAGAGVQLTLNTTLAGSGQTFNVTADALNQVLESNENNNTRALSVQAGTPVPSAPQGTIQADKASYLIGEKLRILFSTNARAYAYIFNVDASGRVAQVFPNSLSSNNLLNAGNYTLPDGNYSFTVTGPVGQESLHLLLCASAVSLGLDGQLNAQFTNPASFSSELQNLVRSQLGSNGWSVQSATFQVTAAPTANQRPTAAFSFTPTNPQVGQAVSFDGSASADVDGQILQYQWDFDGNGSADAFGARVSTTYGSAGSFLVTLTVTDNQGSTGSSSQSVQVRSVSVNQPPVPQFTFSPAQPLVGETVLFDATSSFDPDGVIADYRWDLNSDGVLDVTGSRVTARFGSARDYVATLTVIDNQGGSASASQTVRVTQVPTNQRPTASFTFSPTAPQVGQSVSFDAGASRDPDGALVDYRWDFNSDGTVDAVGLIVSTQFNAAGMYTVTLTVVDNGGLTHSASKSVTVSAVSPPTMPGEDIVPVGRMGVFILGETNQVHVVIQGSTDWSTGHNYSVLLRSSTQLKSPQQQAQGLATGAATFSSAGEVKLTGSIGNGRVDFYFEQVEPVGTLLVFATIDARGRGLETRSSWVYIAHNGQLYHPSRSPFVLTTSPQGSPLFPFAGKTLYTCSATFAGGQYLSCVPLS